MNTEKLYDAFGELLYAVLKVEGKVRRDLLVRLEEILCQYKWGKTALWSFNYEEDHKSSIEDAYQKAFYAFKDYGPNEDYQSFFDMMDKINDQYLLLGQKGKRTFERFKRKLRESYAENQAVVLD